MFVIFQLSLVLIELITINISHCIESYEFFCQPSTAVQDKVYPQVRSKCWYTEG